MRPPWTTSLAISLAAFRIAGGLLLFSIASQMVFGVRMRREGEEAEQALEEHVRNIAAFPLAIPLLAGPGAITAAVLLAGRADGNLALKIFRIFCCKILSGITAQWVLAQDQKRLSAS